MILSSQLPLRLPMPVQTKITKDLIIFMEEGFNAIRTRVLQVVRPQV